MKPIITSKNYSTSTFLDWQKEFNYIYGKQDSSRSYYSILLNLSPDMKIIAKAVRLKEGDRALKHMVYVLRLIFSLIEKLQQEDEFNINRLFKFIDDMLLHKFPNHCYRCLNHPCTCKDKETEAKIEEWKKSEDHYKTTLDTYRKQFHDKPTSINAWGKMLDNIYGNKHAVQSQFEIGLHFVEEKEEIIDAYLLLEKGQNNPNLELDELKSLQIDLVEEIADTISWVYSLISKILKEIHEANRLLSLYTNSTNNVPEISLADVLWNTYRHAVDNYVQCPICKSRPCKEEESS